MREETINVVYDYYNLNIKFTFDTDKYIKKMLDYNTDPIDINPTPEEILEKMDIKIIERFLRKKKLENINK